jgi:hypothetical protein
MEAFQKVGASAEKDDQDGSTSQTQLFPNCRGTNTDFEYP